MNSNTVIRIIITVLAVHIYRTYGQTAVPDTVAITTAGKYLTPFCIDVLSNDVLTVNTTIIKTTNGSGVAIPNPESVYVEPSGTMTVEAEAYHILNERSGTYYDANANSLTWTNYTGTAGAYNGYWTKIVPATYDTSQTKYGPATGYRLIFQSPGQYFVYVRGAKCSGTSGGVHAYSRTLNNSIDFFTYGFPITGISTDNGNWITSTNKLQVAATEIYPNVKYFYIASYSKGVCVDRFMLSNVSISPTNYPESPRLECNQQKEIMYFPPIGYNGLDVVTYTISDGVTSSTASVNIYVNVPLPSTSPTPSPSATPSPSSTPSTTPSPSVTPTRSVTPSSSTSPSVTPSKSPSPSSSPSANASPSVTPSITPSISVSPSVTPTASMTPSLTPSSSATPSSSSSPSSSITPSISPSPSSNPPICLGNTLSGSSFVVDPTHSNANFGQTFKPPVSGKLFSVSLTRTTSTSIDFNGTFYIFGNLQTDAGLGYGALFSIPFQTTNSQVQQFSFSAIQVNPYTQYTVLLDNLGGQDSLDMEVATSSIDGDYCIQDGIIQNTLKAVFQYCMIPDTWPSPSASPTPSSSPSSTPSTSASTQPSLEASSSPQEHKGPQKKKNNSAIIGGAVAGAAVALFALVVGLFIVNKRKKQQQRGKDETADVEMRPETGHYATAITTSQGTYAPIRTETDVQATERASLMPQNWKINYSDIKMEKEIGKGAFGIVYKGTWQGIEVAVKQTHAEKAVPIEEFFAEADLMMKLRPHPNITQLLGICASPLCLVTEYVHNGSLWDWLEKNKLSKEQMLAISRGIATGMLYLHNEGVVHRDLAARNILLDKSLTPKVSDFGMSRVALDNKTNKTASEIGPIRWMAPEAMRQRVYNKKTDVWSYGTVLYEILTRKLPYHTYDLMQVAASVMMGELSLIPDIEKDEADYPPVMVKILKVCLKFNPEDRPQFDKIVQMFDDSA